MSLIKTVIGLIGISVLFVSVNAYAQANRVTLCHCDDFASCQTLEVSENAVGQHLNNHAFDYLGACNTPSPTPTQTPQVTTTPDPTPLPYVNPPLTNAAPPNEVGK